MRTVLLVAFLLVANLSFGQTNYFTFNDGSLFTEKDIKGAFERASDNLPSNYALIPTVYHKISKKDSIINYITFVARKDKDNVNKDFNLIFQQDSVFLFLNKKLPEFKLKDLEGNTFSSTQLIGKPALINFWATSCGPCIVEMPELNELKEKYGSMMSFIALTEDKTEEDNLISFLSENPFSYHILQDADAYKRNLKITAIPRNIFIDKEGYIRYIQANFPYTKIDLAKGIREYDENNYFVKIINKLLQEE